MKHESKEDTLKRYRRIYKSCKYKWIREMVKEKARILKKTMKDMKKKGNNSKFYCWTCGLKYGHSEIRGRYKVRRDSICFDCGKKVTVYNNGKNTL